MTLSLWPAQELDHLRQATIGQVLADQVARRGASPAVLLPHAADVTPVTYTELSALAHRVAGRLAAKTSVGDRIAVWSRNSLDWVVLLYGCALAGVVITPYNPSWSDTELAHADALTKPALTFVGENGIGQSLHERAVEVIGNHVEHLAGLATDTADGDAGAALPEVRPDDPFLIQFTSGTTGRAKAAVLTHVAALNGGLLRSLRCASDEHDTWLNPVPFHHVAGSCALVLGTMAVGGAFVLIESFHPDMIVGLVASVEVTRIGGVPTMVYALLDRFEGGVAPPALRSVSLGGAPVPEALIQRVVQVLGAKVIVGYGQSECPMITSTDMHDDIANVVHTVGRPMQGTEIRIMDPDTGQLLPLDTVGEICIHSPLVMSGYYDMPQESAAALDDDGLLHTGDLGSLDAQGYLHFRGRIRDVIIRGGENIYPLEIEAILLQHPGLDAVAVLGVPDDRWGEQVVAALRRTAGSTVSTDELTTLLRAHVAHYKVPSQWRWVESFPMTASGKIRKPDLLPLFAAIQS